MGEMRGISVMSYWQAESARWSGCIRLVPDSVRSGEVRESYDRRCSLPLSSGLDIFLSSLRLRSSRPVTARVCGRVVSSSSRMAVSFCFGGSCWRMSSAFSTLELLQASRAGTAEFCVPGREDIDIVI